jgi:hypothetical protein
MTLPHVLAVVVDDPVNAPVVATHFPLDPFAVPQP